MKRFAVVLLSVLLVLLPGCTKPVTESGVQSTESGTAESTAEALSSTESGAENTAEKAEHITQTLSSGVVVDADVTVPKAMRQENLPEMQGTGQIVEFGKLKSIFCADKTIIEENESTVVTKSLGSDIDMEQYIYTENGDYLTCVGGNSFLYTAARDTQDTSNLELYKTGEDLDFATIAEADGEIRKVAEELGISVGDSVCYTIDTSSMPHYVFRYDLLVNGDCRSANLTAAVTAITYLHRVHT